MFCHYFYFFSVYNETMFCSVTLTYGALVFFFFGLLILCSIPIITDFVSIVHRKVEAGEPFQSMIPLFSITVKF